MLVLVSRHMTVPSVSSKQVSMAARLPAALAGWFGNIRHFCACAVPDSAPTSRTAAPNLAKFPTLISCLLI